MKRQLAIVVALVSASRGFLTPPRRECKRRALDASFFDDLSKFFLGGEETPSQNNPASEAVLEPERDGFYTGSKRIITVPAVTMKAGGLRLYCNLYLMGIQNTPDAGSWKASKADDSEVNLRYRDLSGSIIVRFQEDEITVDRLGSAPSMSYLAAESTVLSGFVEELRAIVYEGDVSTENRLLTLESESVLDDALNSVSFG
ncbi:hypothetical protein THAOC_09789 [Thalassiosira oceanica]|uniref:Uncharacterized protein n=1 Tax=Thalassiosira oceanica TaxID=159749 RepID=K0TEN4_THAOC|nr:hypothetical protein THAOC_09789 [Thalassiosira oceanica]|mmetsp:Transcript_30357/g.72226  ORF Transcript_30357/g.72226 Transcript_30357/m.72226 type:complete len:201 (+) Transcript_30357:283-885(+)|eukprot:EJK69002.1 hypothetical protein THAOC_09789 [Thalassiosira oceanica]